MNDYYLIGGIVVGVFILITAILSFVSKNYFRVSPNQVAVVFGRKHKHTVKTPDPENPLKFITETVVKGYRIVTGGGFLKIPIIEDVKYLDLSLRQAPIEVNDVPNLDGVMTTVEGVANVKIASDREFLVLSIERFLGKSNKEIDDFINTNLEGHLRAVVGNMTMEKLIQNKEELNSQILATANEDFEKLGIKIDFLNISNIRDDVNYIVNMGRKRAAEIKRNADIGEAEATKDSTVKTTFAEREGVEAANKNQIAIAESDRNRDVKRAKMKAEIDSENERANQAGPLSEAEALEHVVKAQAKTEASQEEANIAVEEMRAKKVEQKLQAEKIVPAKAAKEALIIEANAHKESVIINADGDKTAAIKQAEGEAQGVKVKAFADAEGQAAIIQKEGEAQASAIRAKLLAEAEGVKAKAEAYKLLDQTGKFLEVLNALQTLGPNLVKEFAGVMAASTAHLSNVDEIKIVDFGGDGAGGSAVGKLGNVPNEVMTKLLAGANATGFDVSKLLNFAGFAQEEVEEAVTAPTSISKKVEKNPPTSKG